MDVRDICAILFSCSSSRMSPRVAGLSLHFSHYIINNPCSLLLKRVTLFYAKGDLSPVEVSPFSLSGVTLSRCIFPLLPSSLIPIISIPAIPAISAISAIPYNI